MTVHFFLARPSHIFYSEIPRYGATNIAADFGGIMGICLGMSVIISHFQFKAAMPKKAYSFKVLAFVEVVTDVVGVWVKLCAWYFRGPSD